MILCDCLGLTEEDVLRKIEQGASRLRDLVPQSALVESCGSCFEPLKKMLAAKAESDRSDDYPRSNPSHP